MQREFTIQLRVDYADSEKNAAMRLACQLAAVHMLNKAMLLKDGQKPDIAVYSDDFYSGREQIELIPDTIQSGIDSLTGDNAVENALIAAFGEANANKDVQS